MKQPLHMELHGYHNEAQEIHKSYHIMGFLHIPLLTCGKDNIKI